MASRNEYEMLFKLSAQLGQNFNGTFSSAQKTLAATQKEIQSLNKLQSDISAYVKQQQAVDAIKGKLDLYQQQLRNVQQEMANSTEYNATLANKELELKQKVEQTQISLNQKTEALDRMGDALSEAGVDTSNLSIETQRLGKEVDDLKSKQEKAAEEAKNFGDVGSNAAIAVGDALAAAGIATLLKEIYELYGDCIVGAASFGDEIGTVSVQYGIAAQDLQAYYYAAELVDVSVETLTSTMARNVRAMSEAKDGTVQYKEAYETLGVSVTNADGSLRDSEEVYWDVIDALGSMENASERDALAMELLGRSAQQINTLIAAGSGVMDEYAAMAEEAGYVMDEKMLASVMALDDELQIQNNNMMALKNTIGAQFAPEITAALQVWNDMLAGMTKFAEENPVIVKSLVLIGLELATIVGVYGGYVAIKKTANALKALSAALTAKDAAASGADAAAKTVQATATTAATAAQTGLNAAMSANPIGLILMAVSALTVGVVALTSAMNDASKKEDQLTAKSKAEQEQLKKLNEEYKKVCATYGETSYEAQSLKWEIEELSAAYENGKTTVQEYAEESQEFLDALKEARDEYNATIKGLDREYDSSMALVAKLEELSNSSQSAASNQAAIIPIVDALNEKYQNLGLTFDSISGKFNMSIGDMRGAAQAEIDAKKAEEAWKRYVKLVGDQPAHEAVIAEAQAIYDASNAAAVEANAAWEEYHNSWAYWLELIGSAMAQSQSDPMYYTQTYGDMLLFDSIEKSSVASSDKAILDQKVKAYEDALAEMRAIEQEYGFDDSMDQSEESAKKLALAIDAVVGGYMTADQAAKKYGVSATRINAQLQAREKIESAFAAALNAVRDGFMSAAEAAEFYGVTVESIDAHEKILSITDDIEELSEAYQKVYDQAHDSITGQYKLWDKAADVIPTDIETINTALETQTAYWHDYNVDLQSLKERSADIEGLSDVIESFADGSKESVNVIAGMAQMSDEELGQMVAKWQELQTEQEDASESLATMNQDYASTLDELQGQLAQTIEDLNLEEEAKAAAEATMDAYIKALREGSEEESAIAQDLAAQVGTSLNVSNGATGAIGGAESGGNSGESGGSAGTYTPSQEEMIAVQIVKFGDAIGSGMNAGKSGDNGIVKWGDKEYKVQNSGNAYDSSTPLYKAAVEVLGFGDRQIFGYNGKIYGYLDNHIQELEGRAMSSKGYDKLASDMSANYGSYHTGGLVGDVATLTEAEEFAKLLKGEYVSTPAQMKQFMDNTLPQIAGYGQAETVLPSYALEAQHTTNSNSLPPISISYQIELSGDAATSEDQIRRILDEQNQKLEDIILDILDNRVSDAKRGAYV